MERNTFATSTYIATSPDAAFDYLRDLRNWDEWTLYSRMVEQVDENTWRGTASGYQHDLYYHVRPIETPLFRGVEWHCGFEPGNAGLHLGLGPQASPRGAVDGEFARPVHGREAVEQPLEPPGPPDVVRQHRAARGGQR